MRKFYDEDLQHQYDHDSYFRTKVDQSEITYSALLKKCQDFNPIVAGVKEQMLQKFMGENDHEVYFFYGCLQPSPSRSQKDLLLFLIKNFQPEPGVQFTFVYFNQRTPSSDYYFKFKAVFDLIPLRVIEKMRNFYLVKPYFYIKAFDMFGQSNKILSQRYHTVQNCHQLLKRQNIKVHDFVTFVPEDISEEFPSNLKRRPSLSNYRINVEGQNLSEQQLKQKHDFQQSIKALFTKEVYKLDNYEIGELGVPVVLQRLVAYFKQKPQLLLQEGIFRKSVSIDQQNQTLEELSQRNFGYLQKITNPLLIASLLKKFFSNLKEPIIPYPIFEKLMHDQGVSNKKDYVKQLIRIIPNLNFLSLMFIIDFLKQDVIPKQKQTKMSAHNLAICFSPAFMRSEKASFADIVNAGKSVTITEIMINEFDFVFGNQLDRSNLFKKSIIDRRKILKRNLQEQLEIQIDQRASQQKYNLSLHQNHSLKQEPRPTLSKQVYKNQPPGLTEPQKHKSQIMAQNTTAEENHNVTKSDFKVKEQKFELTQQVQEPRRVRKNNRDLVTGYLKNQKNVQLPPANEQKPHEHNTQPQQSYAKKQEGEVQSKSEKPSVARASIFLNFEEKEQK